MTSKSFRFRYLVEQVGNAHFDLAQPAARQHVRKRLRPAAAK
jgi:hypothetical protein